MSSSRKCTSIFSATARKRRRSLWLSMVRSGLRRWLWAVVWVKLHNVHKDFTYYNKLIIIFPWQCYWLDFPNSGKCHASRLGFHMHVGFRLHRRLFWMVSMFSCFPDVFLLVSALQAQTKLSKNIYQPFSECWHFSECFSAACQTNRLPDVESKQTNVCPYRWCSFRPGRQTAA